MKNLFTIIAVLFGGFVISLLVGAVFTLYGNKTAELILFVVSAVFFVLFSIAVIYGYIVSIRSKKTSCENKDNDPEK